MEECKGIIFIIISLDFVATLPISETWVAYCIVYATMLVFFYCSQLHLIWFRWYLAPYAPTQAGSLASERYKIILQNGCK